MNQCQRFLFNTSIISVLTLLVSSLPASALSDHVAEQVKEASNSQLVDCSKVEVEILVSRWRESYLPAGAALRNCGNLAVEPLAAVMADGTVGMRTRQLTARLIRQIGSEVAVQSLIAALGNYQTQEIAWASVETMYEEPESKLLETISSILVDTDMPLAVRAGAIRFVELYAVRSPQPEWGNTSGGMIDELLAIIANEAEEANLRIWAADALSTVAYWVSGYYPTEIMQPEVLASVAMSENDTAVGQSAMNVLMMTYYMTATQRSCDYRIEEVKALERVLLSIESRSNDDPVQNLSTASDEVKQTRLSAAFSNVMDIAHPKEGDTCGASRGITAGVSFINHVKRKNQPRLLEQVVQWADTLR